MRGRRAWVTPRVRPSALHVRFSLEASRRTTDFSSAPLSTSRNPPMICRSLNHDCRTSPPDCRDRTNTIFGFQDGGNAVRLSPAGGTEQRRNTSYSRMECRTNCCTASTAPDPSCPLRPPLRRPRHPQPISVRSWRGNPSRFESGRSHVVVKQCLAKHQAPRNRRGAWRLLSDLLSVPTSDRGGTSRIHGRS